MHSFNREKLIVALREMAQAMGCRPLPSEESDALVEYVTGDGKNGWSGFDRV